MLESMDDGRDDGIPNGREASRRTGAERNHAPASPLCINREEARVAEVLVTSSAEHALKHQIARNCSEIVTNSFKQRVTPKPTSSSTVHSKKRKLSAHR